MTLLLSLTWAGVVALLLIRAVMQFRSYEVLEPSSLSPSQTMLSVIVPARNEAENISNCLDSLLGQDFHGPLELIVVDDRSEDSTAATVRQIAAKDSRLKLIQGQCLPRGWAGKAHACWQGASAASGHWLCFLDADTTAAPCLLGSALAAVENRQLDMLSLEPFQKLGTFWERLIIPAGFFLLAFCHDLRRVNDQSRPEAVANGQFILIRAEVYKQLGGHACIRSEITEDKALASAVKKTGHKLAVLGGEKLIQTRMYRSLGSLWEGLSKNITETVGGIHQTAVAVLAGLGIAAASVLVPFACSQQLQGESPMSIFGFAAAISASAVLLGTHIGCACHFRIPWWYGTLFPLSYTAGTILAVYGIWIRLRRRVTWKGREYRLKDGVLE